MTKKRNVFCMFTGFVLVFFTVACTDVYYNMLLKERNSAVKQFQVDFDQNGGEGGPAAPVKVAFGQKMPDLDENPPERQGYIFLGYHLLRAEAGSPVMSGQSNRSLSVTEDKRYYDRNLKGLAKWDKSENGTLFARWHQGDGFPIAYYVNDEFDKYDPANFNVNTPLPFKLAALPTESGYTITGWYETTDFAGQPVTEIPEGTEPAEKIFYAKKTANNYTVTFNANGGEGVMPQQEFTYGVPKKLEKNTFTRDGDYKFIDWHLDAECAEGGEIYADEQEFSVPAHDITLYAHWEKDAIPIHYLEVFGAKTQHISPGTPVFFTKDTPLPLDLANLPDETGYTFEGWYETTDFAGQPVTEIPEGTEPAEKIFYAKKTANNYTVTFNANGGGGVMPQQEFTYGIAANLNKAAYARAGFIFNGWTTNADGSGKKFENKAKYITEAADVTLYAQWLAVYTVIFDARDGKGEMRPQNFAQGKPEKLSDLSYTYEGRNFEGWAESPNYKEVKYKNAALYTATQDITLYAVWSVEEFTKSDHDDPAFKEFDIYNPKQLESIAKLSQEQGNTFKDKVITLQGDLDFKGNEFTGIGTGALDISGASVVRKFAGTFDGQGYVIKNMKINSPNDDGVGFIGLTEAGSVIKNLGIDSSCEIIGKSHVGGIVGASGGKIENCYNAASVTGKGVVGGIAGMAYSGSEITKTYNIGKVTAGEDLGGGIVASSSMGRVTDSYYLEGMGNGSGTSLSKDAFADKNSFGGWDFDTIWKIESTGDINGVTKRPLLIEKK